MSKVFWIEWRLRDDEIIEQTIYKLSEKALKKISLVNIIYLKHFIDEIIMKGRSCQ
jgi:hypothetical protein